MTSFALKIIAICILPIVPASISWLGYSEVPIDETRLDESLMLSVEQAIAIDSILWIDARSAESFGQAHIPNAHNLNEDDWEAQIVDVLLAWEPGVSIVIYCSHEQCDASRDVAQRLVDETGFDDVYVLEGGWEAWQAQN